MYTVINAIRLALHPVGGLSEAQEQALQFVLIQSAQANWSFSRMFAHGVSTAQLIRLMRIGMKFTREMTGKSLRFSNTRCRELIYRRCGLKTALAKLTQTPNPNRDRWDCWQDGSLVNHHQTYSPSHRVSRQ